MSARRYARPHEVHLVRWLFDAGLNDCQISRAVDIPRGTLREWRWRSTDWPEHRRIRHAAAVPDCPRCHGRRLDERAYSYLLGLYLGDGCISPQPKGTSYRLRISCTSVYPELIERCREAMRTVKQTLDLPGTVAQPGCVEVNQSWRHWPCLFPQHGPGRKHERLIRLAVWQEDIVGRYPHELLRGLIHSDGWRGTNRVTVRGKRYAYPRYNFSNRSDDIRRIFTNACDALDMSWRRMNAWDISIARRDDVARLDGFIGPKS